MQKGKIRCIHHRNISPDFSIYGHIDWGINLFYILDYLIPPLEHRKALHMNENNCEMGRNKVGRYECGRLWAWKSNSICWPMHTWITMFQNVEYGNNLLLIILTFSKVCFNETQRSHKQQTKYINSSVMLCFKRYSFEELLATARWGPYGKLGYEIFYIHLNY